MYQDQSSLVTATLPSVVGGESGPAPVDFSRLLGTVISAVDVSDDGVLELKGQDRTGRDRWQLSIAGSARFTFSSRLAERPWTVEANFDGGGSLRASDRAMMRAACGALIQSFRAENERLLIRSDDGRAIEVPYALNEDGITINTLLRDGDHRGPGRIVLPTGRQAAPGRDAAGGRSVIG